MVAGTASAKIRIEDILNRMERYRPDLDEDLIRHAYVFAANRHQGQIRRSGEPYFTHPLTVAWILADMELDEEAVAAGLLHDLLEDTDTTAEEIEDEFGPEVARLVAALTKMADFESSYSSREANEAENFRRLLLASMDDVRVILVKLADRLHNMRTLGFLRRERQVAIARETLEIFAPIANRFGIGSIKTEIEDLCFRYLHPKEAEKLDHEIEERKEAADRWFAEIQGILEGLLEEQRYRGHGPGPDQAPLLDLREAQAAGRRCLQRVRLPRLSDHRRRRSPTATRPSGSSTSSGRRSRVASRTTSRSPSRTPTSRSTRRSIGPEGHPFEIQIRTEDMHKIAEYGIAAHWSYKEKGSHASAEDSRVAWLRALLDNSEGTSPREFLDSLKVDLYPDEVYCFTPRGDVFSFPRGATILDFAYRIHTQVGHTCVGGRINGRWVPLKTEIKNGDIVEITTSNRQQPHHDWLSIVATNRARSKNPGVAQARGEGTGGGGRAKASRPRAAQDRHLAADRSAAATSLRSCCRAAACRKEEDLLAAIGFGKTPVSVVTGPLRQEAACRRRPGPRRQRPGLPLRRRSGAMPSRSPATPTFWSISPSAASRCPVRRSSVL